MTDTVDTVTLAAPEVRTFPTFEFRAVDGTEDGKFLEGRAVPYGTWTDVGWFMEQFAPGAFAKSIREAGKSLPLLLWHDNRKFPIGVSHEWRESEAALDVVWRLDEKDPEAMTAARKASEGFMTGLSVGFAPVYGGSDISRDDNGLDWITRTQARLLEVSLTPTPAYAGAKVALVRSRHKQGGDRPKSAQMESWLQYLDQVKGVSR